MPGIDTMWFLEQLDKLNMSQSALARSLDIHRSAVTRLLSGERRMSVAEQDRIAEIFGVSVAEIAARRNSTAAGFGERGQAPFKTEPDLKVHAVAGKEQPADDEDLPDHPIWGSMAGTIKVMPGVDLTAPMEFEWGGKLHNE